MRSELREAVHVTVSLMRELCRREAARLHLWRLRLRSWRLQRQRERLLRELAPIVREARNAVRQVNRMLFEKADPGPTIH